MTGQLPADFRQQLHLQEGVITRAQVLGAGISRHALQVKLDSGRWQRLHSGVYAAFSGKPDREAMHWAAVLGAGPRAVLSHETAAELYGLLGTRTRPGPLVHVMVPRGQRVAAMSEVRLHYSQRLDISRHPVLLPPVTRLEDTILDLAGTAATLPDGIAWILRGCASRRTTPDRLRQTMAARLRLRWRKELSVALGDARSGVQSALEHGYLYRVERPHGLPAGSGSAGSLSGLCRHTRTCATSGTGWWSSWTAGRPIRNNSAGGTSGVTTRRLPKAASRCATRGPT
jgi:hypothetical protein